jgi:hypothetical protein
MRKMEKTFLFSDVFVAILSLGLMLGCQSTAVGPNAAVQKENLLVRSGFKGKTVTTPKQQQRVSGLPPGEISTVAYRGIVLRISNCDQGSHPDWQSNAVQSL